MTDISGTWRGTFSYRMIYQPTPFKAHILCRAGALSGTVSETVQTEFGFTPDGVEAALTGTVDDRRVRFTKIYPDGIPLYGAVDYEGELSEDGGTIAGTWRTTLWSGPFTMQRVEE